MSRLAANSGEFWDRVAKYADGRLDADETRRLEDTLRSDPAALEQFVLYMELHARIAWDSRALDDACHAPAAAAGPRVAASAPSLLARAVRLLSRPTPMSMTVATVVIGVLLTAMAFMVPPVYRALTRRVPPEEAEQYRIVAELSGLYEAKWADDADSFQRGAFLRRGRRIALAAGAATVTYRSGARVTLAGPCELIVDDENRGTLRSGQLVASVPPSAVGFTIDTTMVSVVDLGTEFAVQVVEGSNVTVDVLAGRVSAAPTMGLPQEKWELTAGHSLRFDGAWHVDARDTTRHDHWRQLARRTDVQRISGVRVVDFSSQLVVNGFDRRAEYVVDGSGLVGGGHTTLPDASVGGPPSGTMWLTHGTLTTPHDPLPAHVTFDLGAVYELTGLHVWNYNEALRNLIARGAREVQISVAVNDDVDQLAPLATAQGNFIFPIATGRADYRGFAVPLSEATNADLLARVRLVRLTILSNHGPNAHDESDQYTGLSEVRFAGRSVDPLEETRPNP